MRYILKDGYRKGTCLEHINKLDLRYQWVVDISRYRPNRSNAQNNTYWMWLAVIAESVGEEVKDLHEKLKALLLGVEEKTLPRFLFNKDFGKPTTILMPRSTTSLTVEEFSKYLNAIFALAENLNIKLPMPDDMKLALGLEEAEKRWN